MIDRTLNMKFKTEAGTAFTFAVKTVKADIENAAISEAMDSIMEKDIFNTKGGKLSSKLEANIITKETEKVIL